MARPGDTSNVAGSSTGAPPTLASVRLSLRRFEPGDVPALLALDGDPAVRRFVEDGAPVTREQARATIRQWHRHAARHPGFGCWGAIERRTGEFVGWFHLFARDDAPSGTCELGYRLVPPAWGRGLATEGTRLLVDHAFRATPTGSVVAETMAIHVASRRVMEKSGMRLVAAFRTSWPVRIAGDEFGDVRYQITRAQWLEATSGVPGVSRTSLAPPRRAP